MLIDPIRILSVRCEHGNAFGVSIDRPRLSWSFCGDVPKWKQVAYEIEIQRPLPRGTHRYHVDSAESVLCPWPQGEPSLASGEAVDVQVRAFGKDGSITPWSNNLEIETSLLQRSDWSSVEMISCPAQDPLMPKRPFRVRRSFQLDNVAIQRGRLYITAWGMYEAKINGHRVGDQIYSPGWTSYKHRLNYQVYDVTSLLRVGSNEISAYVGEGWFTGRLAWAGRRNIFGDRNGLMAKLVIDQQAKAQVVIATDADWHWSYGPLVTSEIYDGEVYDGTYSAKSQDAWKKVEVLEFPSSTALVPDQVPIRATQTLDSVAVMTTPSGKTVVDFGQNLVGRIQIQPDLALTKDDVAQDRRLTLSHVEVLDERGEIGQGPLRSAKCVDTIIVGHEPSVTSWSPTFSFHGFRFVQVDGWRDIVGRDLTTKDLKAVVIHSDMKRIGHFECSDDRLQRLHENVVWSMRGNFLSIPTDCPQRDERLGWTGDMAVFGPTACFLYDTTSLLSSWLEDVALEQDADSRKRPPMVVPNVLEQHSCPHPIESCAIWGDVVILSSNDMFRASGDRQVLEKQFQSMKSWLKQGVRRGKDGLWHADTHQFGDWLDPKAPPEAPDQGQTDAHLVANAYLLGSTKIFYETCDLLGRDDLKVKYQQDYHAMHGAFRSAYLSADARLSSHSQAAYALALHFGILESEEERRSAVQHLQELVTSEAYRVSTGFAATPIILETLAAAGRTDLAYRMLLQPETPGWLYMVGKGATTMWERWDSLLPDDSLNPGGMTSFNHYALGSVAAFLHHVVGGISPLAPGWRRILVRPQPGGGLRHAKASIESPYGRVACAWEIQDDRNEMLVNIEIPPNTEADVILPDRAGFSLGSGRYTYRVDLRDFSEIQQ
jgi:alpha-L-rhamnosidase